MIGPSLFNRRTVENFPFTEECFPSELLRELHQQQIPAEADSSRFTASSRASAIRGAREFRLSCRSAPQRCSEDFMRTCRRFADEHDLPVITHVQETRLQVVTGQMFYGSRWWNISIASVSWGRTPRSSTRYGSIHVRSLRSRVPAPLRSIIRRQSHPGLRRAAGARTVAGWRECQSGSDGTCSTMTANMLTVMGTAAAVSKLRGDDYSGWLSAREVLSAATHGGAKALGLAGELGVLQPGAIADLVGYKLNSIAFSPLADPVRQLVYAERGAGVDFCMVGGETVMRDAKLTRIDEAQLIAEIAAEYAQLRNDSIERKRHSAPCWPEWSRRIAVPSRFVLRPIHCRRA